MQYDIHYTQFKTAFKLKLTTKKLYYFIQTAVVIFFFFVFRLKYIFFNNSDNLKTSCYLLQSLLTLYAIQFLTHHFISWFLYKLRFRMECLRSSSDVVIISLSFLIILSYKEESGYWFFQTAVFFFLLHYNNSLISYGNLITYQSLSRY